MKLKILCVQGSFLPAVNGKSLRTKRLFSPLVEKNLSEVHVLVPKRDTSGRQIYNTEVDNYEIIDNFHVHRVERVRHIALKSFTICRDHNVDVIHVRSPRFLFYSLHSALKLPLIFENGGLKKEGLIQSAITNLAFKLSSQAIVLSDHAKNFLSNKDIMPEKEIEVIKNGIDLTHFNLKNKESKNAIKNKYGISQASKVVGYLGRFRRWQGIHYLVRSIPSIVSKEEDTVFMLAGEGPDFESIKKLVRELHIEDSVILPGEIPVEKVPAYISIMDIFVVPRPSTLATETTIPLKVLEGMALQKAIVGTKVGGLEEVIDNGNNGLLAKPGKVDALAEIIVKLLKDPQLRRFLGKNAFRKVSQTEFRWEESAKELYKLYQELIQ